MTTHELKTWPPYFQAVWEGRKTFDVRPAKDRVFGVGDLILMREFTPCEACSGRGWFAFKQDGMFPRPAKRKPCTTCRGSKGDYSGRELTATVTYVLDGGQFGVEKKHVVMAIDIKQRSTASSRLPAAGE